VIAAAIGLFEFADLRRIFRIQQWEFWLSIVCFVGVAVFGVIPGIGMRSRRLPGRPLCEYYSAEGRRRGQTDSKLRCGASESLFPYSQRLQETQKESFPGRKVVRREPRRLLRFRRRSSSSLNNTRGFTSVHRQPHSWGWMEVAVTYRTLFFERAESAACLLGFIAPCGISVSIPKEKTTQHGVKALDGTLKVERRK
jgi:hypothetical protein